MKPDNLYTKIFLDSGDPAETREIMDVLGFLDGQTTNPTLIARNPAAARRIEEGKKFNEKEIYDFYKEVVAEISGLIPDGSVSVEVYADKETEHDPMYEQSKEMFEWITNAHIKFPTTEIGLWAAEKAVGEGMRVNMTLCFSQEQAAAVYAATNDAKPGQVFVSPFIGRLDDRDENGMDLIGNIKKMYAGGDGHIDLLAASIRTFDHFMASLAAQSEIITAPRKILLEWAEKGMPIPKEDYEYPVEGLKEIPYREIDLEKSWHDYDYQHELTDSGIANFSADWNFLIGK
ncbi:transaldolase family protein [Patescibacteria group bacterium]